MDTARYSISFVVHSTNSSGLHEDQLELELVDSVEDEMDQ